MKGEKDTVCEDILYIYVDEALAEGEGGGRRVRKICEDIYLYKFT